MSATTTDESPVPPDRLLTACEVAELLSVPESWVREQTRAGHLPNLPLGRYRRYRRQALLEWIQQQEAGGGTRREHRPGTRD